MMDVHASVLQISPEQSVSVSTDFSGGSIPIPTKDNGDLASFVRVQAFVDDAAAGFANGVTVSPDYSAAVGAAATDFAITPMSGPVILNVHGYSHIRYDRVASGAGTTVGICFTPLENF